jgi:hypothetical protein
MLTHLRIRNFKRLKDVEIPLGGNVVLIGPNNSGKTTALQALTLWDVGMRAWFSRRENGAELGKRPGIAINRRDLLATPVAVCNLLWHGRHVRAGKSDQGKRGTENIRIDIEVEGVTHGKVWRCGFEFDYANEESFVCRPLRQDHCRSMRVEDAEFTSIPPEARDVRIAYLPPMSGLVAEEPLLQAGRVNVLMGQGQTAQVLRNLCFQLFEKDQESGTGNWGEVTGHVSGLFGVQLDPPALIQERGEITMGYREGGNSLDLAASGRGLQQTLLILAYLYANPGTVLLMDEPDAHLEILRQREIYRVITRVAGQLGSQVIAASHSEVVLNEAVGKGTVVAFVGQPHLLNDRGSQVVKALADIGWEHYYQAEQAGWVLYLEGSTDLEILRVFAETLNHTKAMQCLARPYVHYVSNQPQKCRDHFYGVREAKGDLRGFALFDRLEAPLPSAPPLTERMWRKREIENYFCTPDVLRAYARGSLEEDLFAEAESGRRVQAMEDAIRRVSDSQMLMHPEMPPFSGDIKASDDFMEIVFREYFRALDLPVLLRKTDYHKLARLLPAVEFDPEIREVLDAMVQVAEGATPREV